MAEKADGALAGRHVLIVEDEYLLADDVALALGHRGATVAGPVATAQGALDLIAEGGLDVAVVDLNLRDHFAFGVADALIAAGVPLCFATGYDEAAIPERLRALPRFAKPLDMDAMLGLLGRLASGGARAAVADPLARTAAHS